MAIPLGGLATGLDTESLIQQLLAVERRPVSLLEARKVKFQAQATAFQDLNSKLLALRARADALRDPAALFARSASSSAESVATATAGPGTARGTFTLTVASLARGSIATATATRSALTDVVATGDGVISFRLGPSGPTVSVAVNATTTLDDLVQAINDEGAGVKASVVNTGTPSAPAWKLTLTSAATGADSDIVILADDTTLGVANTQAALDASFSIGGVGTFTRPTNTASDVIEGVTVSLRGAGTADLVVDYDAGATEAKVQALIDAYNEVARTIDRQAAATRGSDGKLTPGAFTGDAVTRQIRTALAARLRTRVDGAFPTLADIGITTRREDGTLTLDGARFRAAMAEDPDAVARLLGGTSTEDGVADLLAEALEDATRAVTGSIAARQDGLTASIRAVDRQIETAMMRLEASERLLRARFNALEKTVAQLQSTGTSLLNQLAILNAQLA